VPPGSGPVPSPRCCGGVARVPITPPCLGFLTACRLAARIAASSLSDPYSRVRPEPPATDHARSLPGLGHRDDLSSSSPPAPPPGDRSSAQNAWVSSGEQGWVSSRKRRSALPADFLFPVSTLVENSPFYRSKIPQPPSGGGLQFQPMGSTWKSAGKAEAGSPKEQTARGPDAVPTLAPGREPGLASAP